MTQLLDVEDPNDLSSDEESDRDDDSKEETLYPKKFVVVGSWQEQRYQQALAIIMYRRSNNLKLEFKVEHELDNIRDSNALKFVVLHNEKWYIIGYCGLNKIPKLMQALHAFAEQRLLCHASLLIVKRGLWDKDDPSNKYNSQINLFEQSLDCNLFEQSLDCYTRM